VPPLNSGWINVWNGAGPGSGWNNQSESHVVAAGRRVMMRAFSCRMMVASKVLHVPSPVTLR